MVSCWMSVCLPGGTSKVYGLFLGYFGHNYEVFCGIFHLKYIS